MSPKVSVIIPCYNQAKFLPRTIAALQAQTFGAWECIVIDDGSKDNTAEVVNNIALHEPRVRLIQQPNGGSASARDLGLKHAQGDFIQFLDADDTIDPEKLQRQVVRMLETDAAICYTAFCSENAQGARTNMRFVRLNLRKILVHWGLGASVPIHSFLYRTEFLRMHGLHFQNECRVREDWCWHIRCFATQPIVCTLPDYCGAIYYQNEEGKTGSYIRMQEGNFRFIASMIGELKGLRKWLWLFRSSEEIWIWILRMIKYRSTKIAQTILLLPTLWTVAAILLMPISFWWVLVYFIKTYIAR